MSFDAALFQRWAKCSHVQGRYLWRPVAVENGNRTPTLVRRSLD